MKYIKLFESHEDYGDFVSGGTMLKPNVSHCVNENEVHYNELHDYSKDYLTFDILSSGTIKWKTKNEYTTGLTISCSINDGDWTDITSSAAGASFNVSEGDKVRFKGNNAAYCTVNQYGADFYSTFSGSTASFNAYGNIMSLISGDSFENATTLESQHTFESLFRETTALISAENLILPATTMTYECYNLMFSNCTNLTTAPELPATTLANWCYANMFAGCTSLTTAPELPATTMATNCYQNMFSYCTNLAIAPELPATTLAGYCYSDMFTLCTSLTTAPALPATTLASNCYTYMFKHCTSLTTEAVVPNSVTPVASTYCGGMYCGCSITTQNGKYDSQAYVCNDGPIK